MSRRVFFPFAPYFIKRSFKDLENKQIMCSRVFEWKDMGFKVLKVTMTPRYRKIHLDDEESISRRKNALYELFGMNGTLHGLGKKVSSQEVWLNALWIFHNSLGSSLYQQKIVPLDTYNIFQNSPLITELQSITLTNLNESRVQQVF